jgi:hypothetical protein
LRKIDQRAAEARLPWTSIERLVKHPGSVDQVTAPQRMLGQVRAFLILRATDKLGQACAGSGRCVSWIRPMRQRQRPTLGRADGSRPWRWERIFSRSCCMRRVGYASTTTSAASGSSARRTWAAAKRVAGYPPAAIF